MKRLAIGFGVIALAVGVLTACMNFIYKDRFVPGTTINGVGVGNLDTELGKLNASENCSRNYKIKLKFADDTDEELDGTDINLRLDYSNGSGADIKPQGIWDYISGKANLDFKADYVYDKEMLEDRLEGLKEFDETLMSKPQNAYIADYDGEDFKIVPETKGNYLNKSKASEKITKAVDNLENEVSLTDCYIEADVKEADLVEAKEKLNKMLNASITYTFDDGSKVTIDKSRISDWIDKDTLTVREDKVRELLDTIREKYDTQYKNQAFVTTHGKLIGVSGPYGYVLTKDDECNELIKNITEGVSVTREPIWIRKGNDLTNKSYIEVSLKDQHVWMYVNGELVAETDCVTGTDSNADRRTKPGIYPITYKQSPAVLKGPGYSSPVSYWMPFNGGQGLHDATWRSSFGGSIYKTSGSHGCVNLPLSKAKEIYKHAWKGMPVVVY